MTKAELDEAIKVGETVDIQTSEFDRNSAGVRIYPDSWQPRFYAYSSAVRALLNSGRYTGETFWRGATITKIAE